MLKERLKQVGNLVQEDSLIDIGTDHGYLIIDLLKKQAINSAMAVEITTGPLTNVETNVKNNRLTSKVECVLSDGLKRVSSESASNYQAISICGMGGALIAKIITDSLDKCQDKTLYLQPNNGEPILRERLVELGFTITDELVIVDNDIFYEIIKAIPGQSNLSAEELYFGPINLQQRTATFVAKHQEHYNHLMKINAQLLENNKENQKIINELALIKGVLSEIIEDN
ncbi:tRNA (adenine(22)-N(1))-methyltransferase TrmK [Mollicutes bacterium LVI A0039]|nr:tRNA (adenine(22)-N(1))-methyltransferase TrmK [Mollicutes bacterium LVI A0039]